MIRNPVFVREFLTSLRTRRALALGVVFLLFLAGLVMLLWPAEGVFSLAARSSHKLFILLSLGFLTLVVLCAPCFTAVSITTERERETYDLLYDTLLTPAEIVQGKLSAGIGYILILIVASLPMMGACLILGGITVAEIFSVYLIVTAAAVFFGLLGLYFSAIFHSSYRSLIFCYAVILGLAGGTWAPSVIFGMWAESVHAIHFVRALGPYAALVSIVHPALFQGEHPTPPDTFGQLADSPWPFVFLAVFGSVALLTATLQRVAKPPAPPRRDDRALLADEESRNLSFPFYLLDPRRRKRMIGPLTNVIAAKEMRSKAFARASWLIRAIYICFTVSLVLAFLPLTQIDRGDIRVIVYTCVAIPLGIVILMSPVLTAGAITDERSNGVFDLLRSTRVSAWSLVVGKLQVSWLFTTLLLASAFPTFFVLAYVSSNPQDMEYIGNGINLIRPFNFQFAEGWEQLSKAEMSFVRGMGAAFLVVLVSMVFSTVAGVTASAFSDRSSSATAIAYGLVLAFSFGTMVPWFVADSLPRALVDWAVTLNPFAAAAKAVSPQVFPDQPETLWITHIEIVATVAACLLAAAVVRVWTMMRPQR